jgi:aspartyl-tRNA(Asn)/glutamyl-tRNA(Gln) amidotransferase subunit A
MTTIAQLHSDFVGGADTVTGLVERNIAAVKDPHGEGARAFLSLDVASVRRAAAQSQTRFAQRDARALDGITVSIKDLFDVAGEVTGAGSTVLRSRPPATEDAPAVARLRAAGAIAFGRTNMVEFAYSGVGINPHFGTPRSVWGRGADGGDRADHGGARAPGGSSSGAGVSVADGMCVAALGTDTGGSVRIPAAFNGLVGFKPTAIRVPVLGTIPLSVTHDSIGPLARSVACCAALDAVLSGEDSQPLPPADLRGVRLLKPQATVWRELDPEVEAATLAAVETLRRAGATVAEAPLPALEELLTRPGNMLAGEALDWHTANINVDGAGYDPRVWKRMQLGRDVTRAQYSAAFAFRRFWIDRMNLALAGFDAVICPTVACIPPEIAPLIADDELFFKTNARILRNTSWVNFLDGCALTLPCHAPGSAPVGLQLVARHGMDRKLLVLGAACEFALVAAG